MEEPVSADLRDPNVLKSLVGPDLDGPTIVVVAPLTCQARPRPAAATAPPCGAERRGGSCCCCRTMKASVPIAAASRRSRPRIRPKGRSILVDAGCMVFPVC